MTGLEKVTGKIIADAEADARVILEKAQAECEAIKAKYAAETEAEIEKLTDTHVALVGVDHVALVFYAIFNYILNLRQNGGFELVPKRLVVDYSVF